MADRLTPEARSRNMSLVKGRDTQPERIVRSLLHALGYRFRLHRKDLPGRPDIVLPRHCRVIFVNGCFWHGHDDCRRANRPSSNRAFWDAKIDATLARDARNLAALRDAGWTPLVLWECQLRDIEWLRAEVVRFME